MLIIVEGPDGSGKTTLCRRLARATGMEVLKLEPPSSPEDFRQRLRVISATKHGIWDRYSLISELIYGSIVRGYLMIDEPVLKTALSSELAAKSPLVIYTRPPIEVIESLLTAHLNTPKPTKSKEHCYSVASRYKDLVERYDYVMGFIQLNHPWFLRWNWVKEVEVASKRLS